MSLLEENQVEKNAKILIVDDLEQNLFSMKQLLKKVDVEVFTASSGKEALSLMLQHDYSVVILDVQMPEMDGFEVASLMRGYEQTEMIPIIFVTAISKEDKNVIRGYELGAVDYIFKPVEPLIFKSKVEGFLRLSTQQKKLIDRVASLTRSLDDIESVTFTELFELGDIQQLQNEFCMATGVASIITKPDGTPITEPSNFCRLCSDIIRQTDKGLANCHKSDAVLGQYNPTGPIIRPCMSGGLWDAGAAISIGNIQIANWLIGQVRNQTQSENQMRAYARDIGADEEELIEAFRDVPVMPKEQFENIAQFLYTLANQLSTSAYQNIQQARYINDLKKAQAEQKKLQDKLLQSKKMESIGRLAGGVAHEFNNMLSVILGNAEILLEDYSSSELLSTSLKEIKKAAERSAAVTNQLMAFGSKQLVSPRVLNLNEAIKNILKVLKNLTGQNIILSWKPDKDLWPVKIDPVQIGQILTNLCTNAKEAIRKNGRITIEVQNKQIDKDFCEHNIEAKPGDYVRLTFKDDGCGMNSKTLAHIFEPFYSTAEFGQKAGLGLATVYGIVRQNNGFIDINSQLEKGTCFNIYLPPFKEAVIQPVSTDNTPVKQKETILVVEDEKAILQMSIMMLKRIGYSVLSALTAEEAIQIASENNPGDIHLLMTDIAGLEVPVQELVEKITVFQPELNCLFMSGGTFDRTYTQQLQNIKINYINKPFSKNDLSAKLKEIFEEP